VDFLSWPARMVRGPRALPRWAVATLVANIVIVVTGGLVRLTGSGLGCPTWPKCSADSYVTHPALGIHGAIEFGNRLLTFALVVVTVITWLSAMLYSEGGRVRPGIRRLAAALALGIPAQAVIGGISVLTRLNPFVVALHFAVSMVLIGLAVWLVRATWRLPTVTAGPPAVVVARLTFGLMWVAVWLGTVLTGSGPHAGDEHAVRTGFNGLLVAQLHAGVVFATIASTLICLVLLRTRAAALLLLIEAVQAAVGIVQYFTGVPIWLVALHLLGAALAVAAATNLVLLVRGRSRSAGSPGSAHGDPDRQLLDPVDEVAPHPAHLAVEFDGG
jgi:cytochrome c oxidase assembly protein subunit 15